MKYFAILKDSLREALDSKVLYFTGALSCLVILAVASISFRPEPAEQGMKGIVNQFDKGRMLAPDGVVRYSLEDFKHVEEHKDPWEGTYRFRVVVTEAEPGILSFLVWINAMQREESELGQEEKESRKRLQVLIQSAK